MKAFANIKSRYAEYKALDSADKVKAWKEGLINNAIYLLIIIAVIYTYTQNSRFLSVASIVNIISLSAANIPIACGIAGTIVLTGTDLSAGRVVGLTACISASLFAVSNLCNQNFPGSSGSSDTTGYSDRNRSRRYCWMGKWILRSEIPLTSIHCNTGNTVDRIRNSSDVHYAERKQRTATFRTGQIL